MADILGPANAPNAVTARPSDTRSFGSLDTWFKDCTDAVTKDGTALQAGFFNGGVAAWRSLWRGNGKKLDGTTDIVTETGADDNGLLKAVQQLIQRGKILYGVAGGTANALTVTLAPALIEYVAGTTIRVLLIASNTTAATIEVNGLGTKNIVRFDGSPAQARDLPSGMIAELTYDGTSFQIGNPSSTYQPLTANKTLYVRTDGSDSNDGSANTAGSAFRTIAAAFAFARSRYAFAGYGLTIQLGVAGTYAPPYTMSGIPSINILGDTANIATYKISGSGGGGSLISAIGLSCRVSGVTLENTGIANSWMGCSGGGSLSVDNVTFSSTAGATTQAVISAAQGGSISLNAGITINGISAGSAMTAANGGTITQGNNIALTGTLAFAAGFVVVSQCGIWQAAPAVTASGGTVTGPRYNVSLNGVINTLGGGANYFPGNSAGSSSTGGQYA